LWDDPVATIFARPGDAVAVVAALIVWGLHRHDGRTLAAPEPIASAATDPTSPQHISVMNPNGRIVFRARQLEGRRQRQRRPMSFYEVRAKARS